MTYADEVRDLARRLELAAGTAGSRGVYGLEDALMAAADAARSWAPILDEEDAVQGRTS